MANDRNIQRVLDRDPDYASDTDITKRADREERKSGLTTRDIIEPPMDKSVVPRWLTPKRAARKEATEMLKADKADRAEAKRPPADNVAEEKEMRRARESVRPKSDGGGGADNVAEEKETRRARESVRPKSGGGGSGGVSDTRELQLGADLDPKAMMKKEGYKKGGAVKSASARADGCCIRGKTRA
jgi:hypothetical protein